MTAPDRALTTWDDARAMCYTAAKRLLDRPTAAVDHEDLTQAALLGLWEYGRGAGTATAAGITIDTPLLFAIARRRMVDVLREDGGRGSGEDRPTPPRSLDELLAVAPCGPEGLVDPRPGPGDAAELVDLARAVAALSERERAVLARVVAGDRHEDVAQGEGITRSGVSHLLARARRRLRAATAIGDVA